jgi:hypothetical protein
LPILLDGVGGEDSVERGGELAVRVADEELGTDLSVHTAEDMARYARSLNNRPRKTLGYMKPSERLAELIAHTG